MAKNKIALLAGAVALALACTAGCTASGGADAGHHTIPAGLAAALDLTHVAAVGHSLGGATSAELAYEDHQITSVADLDGALFGKVVGHGLTQPFLIMAGQAHDRTSVPNWAAIWPHLRGEHLDLKLRGAGHFS